jgi:penicillin G amidase
MNGGIELQTLKRKKRFTILLWFGGVCVLVVAAGLLGLYYFVERSIPKTSGSIELSILTQDVEVIRDKQGVPHISGANEKDLFIAQGYVQAQDRLFQMDLSRRQASGRLSEVIGGKTVERDKFFRTLGLRRAAEVSYTAYPDETKQILEWYAEGVNAFMNEMKEDGSLPVEFILLGYKPEKWTPIDSLTIGKYMAFDLGGHWQGQAFRYWALKNLGQEKAFDLFPSYPEDAPEILSSIGNLTIDIEDSFAEAVIPPEFNGSNNWVVSGEKTANGKPLLADDPHLSLGSPSIWYQMHLKAQDLNVSGVIFAGIPGIILGHNEEIAWGVTNTGPDVQDLYIEQRNGQDPTLFKYNDNWEQATIIEEPIRVKGEEEIKYEVVITRHGPIISEFANQTDDRQALSLRWTALDPSLELQAILNINKAGNWQQFEKALEDFHTPTQNFVFAAKDGTIAYKANGKIPIRKKGDGLLPVPGWDPEYEWEGFIPFDELPLAVNPGKGFAATANNKVIDDSYPYHISHHWAQPYRYMRISQYLEENDDLTIEDMKKLQMDQVNIQASEFVPIFIEDLKDKELSSEEKQALKILQGWDYRDDKSGAAPLLFHLWMNGLTEEMFKKEIPPEMMELFEGRQMIVDELLRKAHNGDVSSWFDPFGGYESYLQSTLNKTLDKLHASYGPDMNKWQWGKYHKIYFEHPISSASPLLEMFFNKKDPVPVGGSRVTVQAASYNKEGIVNHGASWRFVIDAANLSEGYHIVGPGQSGHFKSKWYDDQIEAWVEGDYHKTSLREEKGNERFLLKAD